MTTFKITIGFRHNSTPLVLKKVEKFTATKNFQGQLTEIEYKLTGMSLMFIHVDEILYITSQEE